MPPEDRIRFQHILDAAGQAQQFIAGRQCADLRRDRQLLFALVKCVEIIGEAAAQISTETQATCQSIPWPQIKGMRNRLIHAYFDINIEIVWDTVTDDLPTLTNQVRAILERPPGQMH